MDSLPFKVGQQVETRSFQAGYRGAWFRCEIKEAGQKGFGLEYFDYSDEKLRWMKVVYQKPPWRCRTPDERWLMLRPQYPQIYSEDEVPDINTLSEIVVVRDGTWKAGDLVDWFCDGAYWSGKITKIKGQDKVEIELHPRPSGEGSSYEVLSKNLRPSLEWSLKSGWSLPVTQGGDHVSVCARLILPAVCELRWMKVVYQIPPWRCKTPDERWLMLHPQYPQIYSEDEIPDINTLSEIVVVRDGAWKAADMVDWFCDGAYWSGTITKIKGQDKVEIELHPRPSGEGLSYEALCKNLRPSLEWSLKSGWSLPVSHSQEDDNVRVCARLILPAICETIGGIDLGSNLVQVVGYGLWALAIIFSLK